ncbi:hypothetical protein I4U23_015733 [Adineta vaga]|nr:hypothetical protein I4U23_015733 [Adineta vaga]
MKKTVETITDPSNNHQATKSVSKRQRSRSIIREFSLNTSTHGIPGIARSESYHNRIFWSVSLLLFIGIMLYFIIKSILAYFQYPTQTSIDIVVEWPQAFPAVTLCNYSPYFYSRFIGPFLNYTNTMNLTNTTDTTKFTLQQASYVREFARYNLQQEISLTNFSYPLEVMLMSCSYNDIPCSAINFTSFVSLRFGTCYTFNLKTKNMTNGGIKYSSDNGGEGKLAATFYIHHHQYIPYITQAVGMMVTIHDNNQLPIVASSGMQLSAGKHHKISYTKRTNLFLPSPYTTCTNDISPAMQSLFNRYPNIDYAYSQTLCYSSCIQTYIYPKCGCVNPAFWGSRFIKVPGMSNVIAAPLCNWTDPCPSQVTTQFYTSGEFRDAQCPNCGQECTSNTFTIKSSTLNAPVESQMDTIRKFVQSLSVPLANNWSTNWQNEIRENYVSLEVTCETTRTEIYTQQAALSAVDVISNVGGQTGLWIGISFLSLFEMIEMIYRLFRSRCHALKNTMNQTRE